ncbi:hypothetical protein M413DRAFT_291189 [Hebeloma cylindrosporum]|uniref:Uncharacterized protein n=1 Tax=Hebeloma cylindrosporum TaxID=76867 RepID=A0A0C3BHW1_HEBCY|nr:hypothetical protein M413DRAFT_291189 [Hebeloma cylindrosporum h7]
MRSAKETETFMDRCFSASYNPTLMQKLFAIVLPDFDFRSGIYEFQGRPRLVSPLSVLNKFCRFIPQNPPAIWSTIRGLGRTFAVYAVQKQHVASIPAFLFLSWKPLPGFSNLQSFPYP